MCRIFVKAAALHYQALAFSTNSAHTSVAKKNSGLIGHGAIGEDISMGLVDWRNMANMRRWRKYSERESGIHVERPDRRAGPGSPRGA